MTTVKYDSRHHAGSGPEQRTANRLKNSGGEGADHIIKKGDSPSRVFVNIHDHGQGAGAGRGPKVGDK
jgi:hypothetical protein